jgi:hypothetical protein
MALVFSSIKRDSAGSQIRITGKVAFDASYPTGGEAFNATDVNLSRMDSFETKGNDLGYTFDASIASGGASGNLLVYTAPNTEVSNGTDLSALNDVEFEALGS